MNLNALRREVLEANLELARKGLVLYTFGNASGISRSDNLVVIKPSGVPYEDLRAEDMVVTDLEGRIVEGSLRPSSDLPTHLVLYRAFPTIGGVVHTHSTYATAWAQAKREIPCFGTTHADYFYGPIPVTEMMRAEEIDLEYEVQTGHVIVRRFSGLSPERTPACLVASHGPFCWGPSPCEAAHIAVIVEELARLAHLTTVLNPQVSPISPFLLKKHFTRKHGPAAYYGQTREP
ncbi:MAG TPA: L-ribulose-5-phosphate 4-epimerase [Acidobacteriota bacterium]|jgi:L-ribulose-5-phosphate 4-epimerase|nr:L-ribulose-5-phosphate 4-epimerase [Acidobacteriota bacterium]